MKYSMSSSRLTSVEYPVCMPTEEPSKVRKDLGVRTAEFAERVRHWVRKIPRTLSTIEDAKQLLRSSGSVGANYIEANEAFSKKDRAHKMKICRKEAKESTYWLRLLSGFVSGDLEKERLALCKESHELMLIFNAIINKYLS